MTNKKSSAKSRGRKPGFTMSEEHRVKIKNSNILNALVEHVEGKREMSSTQVTAGLGLLKKVLPDLAQTDVTSGGEKIEMPTEIIIRAGTNDNGND
jgi:hypothetical protein